MKSRELLRRVLALPGLLAVVLAVYLVWARPYQLRWGATDEEVRRGMPGDELSPHPTFLATRAITINGTPQQIWPWLMQMGFTRAGLYGYDLFQRVGSPTGMQGTNRILPQFQDFTVGDDVPVSPVTNMVFESIEPNEHIVWGGEQARAITWGLYAMDASQTRLVSRTRWSHRWTQPGPLALDLMTEFTDHLAMRKVLEGVKGRVEGRIEPRGDLNIEFFIYLGSFLVFIWAAISVVRLPLTLTSWLVGLCGGITWLIAWYAPVSIWTGPILSLLVVWAIRVEYRDLRRLRMIEEQRAQPRLHGKG